MGIIADDNNWWHRQTLRSRKASWYGNTGLFKSILLSSTHTTQWRINNLLNDRQQQVVVDNATFSTAPVTSGIPQGTVLGPTLFLIYINDIADITSTIRIFANDCVIYKPILCQQDYEQVKRDLNTLVNWSDSSQIEFNIKKCAIMQFGKSTEREPSTTQWRESHLW